MKKQTIRIALSAMKQPVSIPNGVERICTVLHTCQKQKVEIICTPETYLPGLRGASFDLPKPDQPAMEKAVKNLQTACKKTGVAAIVGLEWVSNLGLENRAIVISPTGRLLGHQTKNQITPGGEEENYVPDGQRKVFTVNGVKFGIVICHEGWRYPETTRWAVLRGAQIVFQPQVTGSDNSPRKTQKWGVSFYEKSMQCRAAENTIYFASVNQAMRHQNSTTSLIDPSGNYMAHIPYGKEDLLIADLDLSKATRLYAKRYHPEWYPA
jgi:predicted amidohydrolase